MIFRKIEKSLNDFYYKNEKKALLVTGARQVGKTYVIRELGKKYEHFVEINFLENQDALDIFSNASNTSDILLRLSVLVGKDLVPGKTLVFFDEVQECKEIVTAIKFLVEEGSYQYILSGSLLGVELNDIRSVPVGYMIIEEMFPLDFEEFLYANNISEKVIAALKNSFENKSEVDIVIHKKIMELYKLYLIVGGMPAVVDKYLLTNNISEVINEQNHILELYRKDISKYDYKNTLHIKDIFNLIPREINSKNKRFILKNLNENQRFSRFKNSFLWLKEAGVALPVYCVSEPKVPLKISESTNLFKLFLCDVGLLSCMLMDDIQIKILKGETNINYGAIYENAVAQELNCHGFDLYYFMSKKQGEVDFLIESEGKVVPIEIKSGKDYYRHIALDNVIKNSEYDIDKAYVFSNSNVKTDGRITYMPIYMLMFLEKQKMPEDMIYKIDTSMLS